MIAPPLPTFYPGPGEFIEFARCLLLGGDTFSALKIAETQKLERPQRVLKAAVTAGTTSDPDFAAALADYKIMSNGFLDSLRSICAFDALLPSMRRVPVSTRSAIATVGAAGYAGAEVEVKPIARMTLDEILMEPRKAIAILVITSELARHMGASGDALLGRELRAAVASATDALFLAEIANGATSFASSGAAAADIYQDIGTLLGAVVLGQTSRPNLIMSAETAGQIAAKPSTSGAPAFPEMSPQGGHISGIPVLACDVAYDSAGGSQVLLVDADAVAADSTVAVLDTSRVATLAMDGSPASDESQPMTSLFQTNTVGLKAERYFAFQVLRDSAIAKLTDADYSMQS